MVVIEAESFDDGGEDIDVVDDLDDVFNVLFEGIPESGVHLALLVLDTFSGTQLPESQSLGLHKLNSLALFLDLFVCACVRVCQSLFL